MVPSTTRRRLLQVGGIALASGLAGCELRHDPVTETTTTTDRFGDGGGGGDGQGGGGASDDGSGGGGQNGNGQSDEGQPSDGDGTTRTPTPTRTVTPDRTFTVEVENKITAEDLERSTTVPAGTPATVTMVAEENWSDGTEKRVFDRTIDLDPGESRRFPEAFTTKLYGPNYIMRTRLEEFPGERKVVVRSLSDARRFTPGGYNDPGGTTFRIVVGDGKDGAVFAPYVIMGVPGEE